jgi:hypothetical protein
MPPGQVLALTHQPITAGGRKPVKGCHIGRRQRHAIRHAGGAVGIVLAAAGTGIQHFAGGTGEQDFARVFFLEFDQTAARTTIAQAFPFRARHVVQPLCLPEWFRLFHVCGAFMTQRNIIST